MTQFQDIADALEAALQHAPQADRDALSNAITAFIEAHPKSIVAKPDCGITGIQVPSFRALWDAIIMGADAYGVYIAMEDPDYRR